MGRGKDYRDTLFISDFTQGVGRRIECWCYGQHQPLTNPCIASLLDCHDLSQYTHQLFVTSGPPSSDVARYLEPLSSLELSLVQAAVGTVRLSNDPPGRLSRARRYDLGALGQTRRSGLLGLVQ